MKNLLILLTVAGILYFAVQPAKEIKKDPLPDPCPDGKCIPKPPPKPRRPWGDRFTPVGAIKLGREISPLSGSQVDLDFPDKLWMENIGSNVDGSGMCVNTSIEHSFAIWHGRQDFRGFRDYWAAKETGGSWPERVDKHIAKWTEKTGKAVDYINFEGTDLKLLELAVKTGRMPAITYGGFDGVRYSGRIAHMVNLVHLDLDKDEAAILDNNGSTELIWMDVRSFNERWTSHGKGWAVIPILNRPPLPPRNYSVLTDRDPIWTQCEIPPGYTWKHVEKSWYSLLYYGTQIGAYDSYKNKYQPIIYGGEFGKPVDPPIFRPILDGVVVSKLGSERYRINGVDVTKGDVESAIVSSAKLVDDRWKLDLVFIGSKEECDSAIGSLECDLTSYRVFSLRPTDWQVDGMGFKVGKPMVYIQKDGEVLHRQEGVEGLVSVIRKLDPQYDASKDPDLRQWIVNIPREYMLVGLILVLMAIVLWGKK